MVRLDEPDGNTGLDPLRSPLRHKTLGAVCRSEAAVGNRIFDPNVLAHSSGIRPVLGLRVCPQEGITIGKESFGGCALRSPVEPASSMEIYAKRRKVVHTPHHFFCSATRMIHGWSASGLWKRWRTSDGNAWMISIDCDVTWP